MPAPPSHTPPARAAFAAAHVVRRAGAGGDLPVADQIDWEPTIRFRRYLWSLGLGVAEAMDTAQRSLLGWEAASELIDRTLAEARRSEFEWPAVIAGAGTDGIAAASPSVSDIVDEWVRQGTFIQERRGTVMLLATPLLPRLGAGEADYVEAYSRAAEQLARPVFVHWLGEMFAGELRGYFPGESFWKIMEQNAGRIAGVKLSLLDENFEVEARRRLAANGQVILTGDDFNYSRLIRGAEAAAGAPAIEPGKISIAGREFPTGDFSHALLGVFAAIARPAAHALEELSQGNTAKYSEIMDATVPLGRAIFEHPTEFYKAGVVFLAWLNGHQDHFSLIGDLETRRPPEHYERIYELALKCGAITNPELAAERAKAYYLGTA